MTDTIERRSWRDGRLWDLVAGTPLILFCVFGVVGTGIEISREAARDMQSLATIAAQAAAGLFLALELVLTCIRRLPLAKAPGLMPRLWGILGANFSYVILLFPKAALGIPAAILSATLGGFGALASALVLIWLGRGFSVLPQARQLQTSGPYRLVRHPLYLCEQVSLFGVCLQYQQPWAFLIVLVGLALQFPRMRYEEQILAASFPEYPAYQRDTPMLLPGWR